MTTLILMLTALALAAPDQPTPPPDVEPGSTREAYKVKPGDTLASIANEWGFLPDDLRSWNELEGEPEPGTVIYMWVAPVEGTADEPKPKKERPAAAGNSGVGFFAGAQVGPAISLNELGPAFTPRIEVGVELPPMDRALRIWVAAQYLAPRATGSVDDPRVGGSFDYDVKQDELSIAFGPAFRLTMLDAPVIPEVSVGPSIFLYRSTANGSAGGEAFPEVTEQYTRLGVYAQLGAALPLGPGELTAHLAIHSSGLDGVVTGDEASLAMSPLVGYRFVF